MKEIKEIIIDTVKIRIFQIPASGYYAVITNFRATSIPGFVDQFEKEFFLIELNNRIKSIVRTNIWGEDGESRLVFRPKEKTNLNEITDKVELIAKQCLS